ncbi:MAG: pilus assembly protein TadG-related protein [Nocardioides sp.]|jgi:uncharacterized membrane protein
MTRERDERGQSSLMIVGLAVVLMMAVAVAVDSSAAFLHRQRLDNVAEGAALYAADAAAEGREVYTGGLGEQERLLIVQERAAAAARDYLARTGAPGDFPGLSHQVTVADDAVRVSVQAPLRLPLTFPGVPLTVTIGATGASAVTLHE